MPDKTTKRDIAGKEDIEKMNRIDGRENNQLRPVKITTGFVDYAEGSVLIECGHTKVLCCASG